MDASHERQGHVPMDVPAKRSYQPIPLELVGSSQSKRQTFVSVSAATVAVQVGVSSSVSAKPRNPGQREVIPTKHFGEYHGSDKVQHLDTTIRPEALAISHHQGLRRHLLPQFQQYSRS